MRGDIDLLAKEQAGIKERRLLGKQYKIMPRRAKHGQPRKRPYYRVFTIRNFNCQLHLEGRNGKAFMSSSASEVMEEVQSRLKVIFHVMSVNQTKRRENKEYMQEDELEKLLRIASTERRR